MALENKYLFLSTPQFINFDSVYVVITNFQHLTSYIQTSQVVRYLFDNKHRYTPDQPQPILVFIINGKIYTTLVRLDQSEKYTHLLNEKVILIVIHH